MIQAVYIGTIKRTLDFREPVEGQVHEIMGADDPDHNGHYFVPTCHLDSNVVEAYLPLARKITLPATISDFGKRPGGVYSCKEDRIHIPPTPCAREDQISQEDPRHRALVQSLRQAHSINPVVIL